MSVEIVGAIVALRDGNEIREYSSETFLVNSACRTLLNAPRQTIDAITVSLPAGNARRLADLQALCRRLARQHSLRVQMASKDAQLKVRITRAAGAAQN
jgi:hypothetical protein